MAGAVWRMLTRTGARRGLAAVCGLGAVIVIVWASVLKLTYEGIQSQLLAERPFNDLTEKAVDIVLEQSTASFQLGLLVLAALWGLIISKKDETTITLGDVPELLMFVASSLLLLSSFIWHWFFLNDVKAAFALAGRTCSDPEYQCIPDILADTVLHQFVFQNIFLVVGMFVGIATLVSAHKLKE
jgi:hypothetical protein